MHRFFYYAALLPLVAMISGACGGGGCGCNGGREDDTARHTGAQPDDSGEGEGEGEGEGLEVEITAELPAGVYGTVSVYPGTEAHKDPDAGPIATCDLGSDSESAREAAAEDTGDKPGLSCAFTVTAAGTYWVLVSSDTALFLAKTATVDEDGTVWVRNAETGYDEETATVSWFAGGCVDADWSPEAYASCSHWQSGEWGLAPNGDYYSPDSHADNTEISTKQVADVDDDGQPDIVMTIAELGGGTDFRVAGSQAYAENGSSSRGATISTDTYTITLYNNIGDGDTFTYEAE